MIVLVGSAALGPRLAAASQVLYLLLGVAGVPVFAASPLLPQGAGRLLGPTAGFLFAYPVAAAVTGWLAERGFDRRYLTSIVAMLAGLAMLFMGGVLWLAYFPQTGGAPGLRSALAAGFYPFVIPDIVKVCLAALILPAVWRIVDRSHTANAIGC